VTFMKKFINFKYQYFSQALILLFLHQSSSNLKFTIEFKTKLQLLLSIVINYLLLKLPLQMNNDWRKHFEKMLINLNLIIIILLNPDHSVF